ncbi:monovalent cation/H(+) antiporter subunit G [Candidatus Margulisiibacteriota bacterium]
MINENIGLFFIVVGLFFNLVGAFGLVRMPDLYNRLQAATKCVTLGTCALLFGAAIYMGVSQASLKAGLCILFILLTSPTAAHAISRGAHIYGVKLWSKSVVDKYDSEIDRKLHWGKEV